MFNKACNLSDNERIVRMAFGLSLLLLALYTLDGGIRVLVIVLSTVGIVTGIVRYDPFYDLFNVSTYKKSRTVSHKKSKRSRRR
jgi:hypothetical protein